jgi:DNA-binding FadR family transcriptional regulator
MNGQVLWTDESSGWSPESPAEERVSTYLRTHIESGVLKAGDRLPAERELALEAGVNRATVRTTLKRLESIGLVRSRRGAGTFLRESAEPDARPLVLLSMLNGFSTGSVGEVRSALYRLALGLAMSRVSSWQHLAMLEAVIAMFAALDDPPLFGRYERKFWEAVVGATNNPFLSTLIGLVDQVASSRVSLAEGRSGDDLQRTAEGCRRVCDALRAGDAAAASDLSLGLLGCG